jgi:hypothetical protein
MSQSRAYQRARSGKAACAAMIAQREQRVLEMRAAGYSFRDIGRRLNISPAAAEAAFAEALAKIPARDAKQERTLQLQRIGWIRERLRACLDGPTAKGKRCPTCHSRYDPLAIVEKSIRLEERLARLEGFDRPSEADRHPGAPPKFDAIDPKTRTEAIERLAIPEQRTLLYLVRKMRGEPLTPLPPLAPQPTSNGHDPSGGSTPPPPRTPPPAGPAPGGGQ